MGITVATTLRVMPGKQNQLFETLKAIKKVVEDNGGTYAIRREVAGPQPNAIIAVAQYPDWSNYGKVRSDTELQKLMERNRNSSDPAAEVVTTLILEDVAL